MSQVQLTVTGEKELSDAFDLLSTLLVDLKAGVKPLEEIAAQLPGILKVANEASALAADVTADPLGSAASALVGGLKIAAALKG